MYYPRFKFLFLVEVVYNDRADGEFCSYPAEFQEKALEIIKKKLEEGI